MQDTLKYVGLRKQLVALLDIKGINDVNVLKAIDKIPRHLFVESFLASRAYEDIALPIESGQTISQPYTVAFQTELLKVKKGDKVLEIGTGSGYQTAVLLEMGAKVYTIERHLFLHKKTTDLLSKLGYKPYLFLGDGYEGKPTYGPYDKIIITAACPEIPEKLLKQLKVGGIMVAPVGETSQTMTRVLKVSENEYEKQSHGSFVFVPMLTGIVK